MTRQRYIGAAAAVAALGGAAWITKVAVLAATDGDDSALVSALWTAGILLMTFGATWIGVRLAGDRPLPVVIALAVPCVLLPFMTFEAVIDPLAEAAVGDLGPSWFAEESGILATGLVWLAASLPAWLARTTASATPSARLTT